MFHENEIVMLFLCIGVLVFIFLNRKNFNTLKGWRLLLASFLLLLAACVSTVVEGFLMEKFFNYIEHFSYAGSGLILATWCYSFFKENKENSE